MSVRNMTTVEPAGAVKMSSHPKFVLNSVICIEKGLKGTEIEYVLTGNSY